MMTLFSEPELRYELKSLSDLLASSGLLMVANRKGRACVWKSTRFDIFRTDKG
jgi:hypothetical protein